MALHAPGILALFVDAVRQAPIVVQCAQAAPEAWWKWWAQSVIPVAGGTLIAVWSFVQNRKSEQKQWERNRKAGRQQWVRDQKMAEWSGLLRTTAEVQRVLRVVNTANKERKERIVEELKPALHELLVASANRIFLREIFADPVKREKFYSFIKDADDTSERISGLRPVHRSPDFTPTLQESGDLVMRILSEMGRITEKYFEFHEWLRKEAAEDLGIALFEETAMRE
jgi:hypothetical protein